MTLFNSYSLAGDGDPQVLELKQHVASVIPTLQGWCTQEKAAAFIDLILEIKPEVCVEIGVYAGSSLFPVASALQFLDHGIVIGIDAWDKLECIKHFDPNDDEAHLNWWGKLNIDAFYYLYLNTLRQYDLEDYCITMRATSERAAPAIGSIDFLHIDGNHSEVVSAKDVELYLPKVRTGGYICINDTLWPQMQKAVELLMDFCDPVQVIDNGNAILFQKR